MGLYLFVNGLNRIALWQNARNPSDLFNAQFHSQLYYYHGLFTVFKFFYGLTDCSLTFLLPASRVYVSCLDMNIFTSITNILSPGSFFSTFLFLFRSFSQFFSSFKKMGKGATKVYSPCIHPLYHIIMLTFDDSHQVALDFYSYACTFNLIHKT